MSKLLKMSAAALAIAVIAAGPISSANAHDSGHSAEWRQLKRQWHHHIKHLYRNTGKIDAYLSGVVHYNCDRDRDDCGYAIRYAKDYIDGREGHFPRTRTSIAEELGVKYREGHTTGYGLGLGIFNGIPSAWYQGG